MPKGSLGDLWGSGLTWSDLLRNRLVSISIQVGSLIVAFLFLPFTIIIKGLREISSATMKMRKTLVKPRGRIYRVVWFFQLLSSTVSLQIFSLGSFCYRWHAVCICSCIFSIEIDNQSDIILTGIFCLVTLMHVVFYGMVLDTYVSKTCIL